MTSSYALGVNSIPAPTSALDSRCRQGRPATRRIIDSKNFGISRPRLAVRRSRPAQAFGVKKYFRRCSPGVSKTSDKEDPTPFLWDSKIDSVQNPVCDPIPAVSQRPDDGAHVPSSVD